MNLYASTCRAAIGSTTSATRAQRILAKAAIRAEVVKLSSASSRKGCVYGVAVSCEQRQNVETILRSAGIPLRGWQSEERKK